MNNEKANIKAKEKKTKNKKMFLIDNIPINIDCHLLPLLVKNGDYYKIKLDIPKHKIPNNEIGG